MSFSQLSLFKSIIALLSFCLHLVFLPSPLFSHGVSWIKHMLKIRLNNVRDRWSGLRNKLHELWRYFGQSQWAHYAHYEGAEFDEKEGKKIFGFIHFMEYFLRKGNKARSTNSNVLCTYQRTHINNLIRAYNSVLHICESAYQCASVSLCHFHFLRSI